ncbi:MAG: aminomethyltransferase beta-barrel domain-containing protein, partial [Planctomycetota bacterium]
YWVDGRGPELPLRCSAKTRYRQADQSCTLQRDADGIYRVIFDAPQRAVTPGQSVVFYSGETCLGGGVIEATEAAFEAADVAS